MKLEYGVMGVLRRRCLVAPKSSAPHSGETVHQITRSFGGARMCSRSSIIGPSLVGLGFHPPSQRPKTLFLPAALCAAQACRYLIYSEADFEVFRPAGCTDGGKIWHGGGCQISPPSVQRQGCRTPKTEISTQITETILIPLDRGKFVVVHTCSTFSDCCQLATPLNAEVQNMAKYGKIGFFYRQRATE